MFLQNLLNPDKESCLLKIEIRKKLGDKLFFNQTFLLHPEIKRLKSQIIRGNAIVKKD
jgi:hypothetical protein